jgi:VanZ family protein
MPENGALSNGLRISVALARPPLVPFPPVSATRRFLQYWLPALVWMLLIFAGSTNLLSSQHTSRFLVPFLHWLLPGLSDRTIDEIHLAVRKTGHLSEYSVLAILLWRARRQPVPGARHPWRWAEAAFALGVASVYAASDEFHQTFYSSRGASVHDALLDTLGAAIGLALVWAWGRWRKQW